MTVPHPRSQARHAQADAPGSLAAAIDASTADELRARGALKWTLPGPGEIGAFVAEMDFGVAPPVTAALQRCLDTASFGYLPEWLEADHGRACADWQRERYDWDVEPGNVHAVGDVLKVLEITIDHFTRPGTPVILPTPAYMPFFAVPPEHGRDIIEVPCHDENGYYTLDLDGIVRAFEAGGELLILCNPHNPVGRVLGRDELLAVAEVVQAHGGRVFADEIHAPLTYPDALPHVPYASVSPQAAGHTVTATSMSKAFNLPGLTCAAAILSNERDAKAWAGFHHVVTHGASTLGVAANIAAYREGAPWLAQVLDYLAGNRAMLADLVRQKLPGVRFRPPDGTYLAWLDFRALHLPASPGEFLQERAGVWVNDGPTFGAPGAGFARLNMATPRPILVEIVDRIAAAVGTLREAAVTAPLGDPPLEVGRATTEASGSRVGPGRDAARLPSLDGAPTTSTPWQELPEVGAIHRRAMRMLIAAQIVGGIGIGAGASLGALLAEAIAGSEAAAGLARTFSILGTAAVALPLAMLATRRGRRIALSLGWALAFVGAVLLVVSAAVDDVPLLMVGMLLFGSGSATNLQSRYAATDLAEPRHRARALSIVVWSTTIGSVLGPNLAGPGTAVAAWLHVRAESGGFVIAAVVLAAGAVLMWVFLRPDPLLTAQHHARLAGTPHRVGRGGLAITARAIGSSPITRFAFVSIVLGQTVMAAVMTMTPVHMMAYDAGLDLVGMTISVHVLGMFAFSPLVGMISDRIGRVRAIGIGQVLFVAAAIVAGLSGNSTTQVTIGLFLLGLGWSFALVAGSTLLGESVEEAIRPTVQGTADMAMNLLAAVAAGVSGVVQSVYGFGGLNLIAGMLTIPVLLLMLVTGVSGRKVAELRL